MRTRAILPATALTAASLALSGLWASPAAATKVCTWAGTPAQPTGTFTISPGLKYEPSAGALRFNATGALGGECAGTMTFSGRLDAGATCAAATFEGAVRGLPGVARFWGEGSLLVPSILYDRAGNVVGEENAEIVTEANGPHALDCTTAEGFRGGWPGMFSSVLELR